ncbi:MAG: PhzF family phenazine biosynthesis protein [Nocardiopsis sp. BM-2018]|nr:MAG: PhzF family phenazine biosynthesis protein [Nocardiopsis sp. BM-2018]
MSASASEADLTYQIWDVFTDRPFAGNPLAVVFGADALGTTQMQTLAREFNLSETIFVQAPRDPAHTARVRIFFPTAEIPFAGHPTIGCAIALSGLAEPGPDAVAELVLEEEAGLVPVTVTRKGEAVTAEFAAPVLPHAAPGTVDPAQVAAALGLAPGDLGCTGHPAPALWQGGPAFLYVPLRDVETLGRARPHEPAWSAAMAVGGVDSAWCYTPVTGGYRARMFSPTAGIPEDPATGSAAAIFAAELAGRGLLAGPETRLDIAQGVEMGRPSLIGLTVRAQDALLTEIRVSGQAVRIARGSIMAPAN